MKKLTIVLVLLALIVISCKNKKQNPASLSSSGSSSSYQSKGDGTSTDQGSSSENNRSDHRTHNDTSSTEGKDEIPSSIKPLLEKCRTFIANPTFSVTSSDYKEAKDLVKDAKKIYKGSSDLAKIYLRFVRFSTNFLLGCINLRKNSWESRKAALLYLSVAGKDLGIAAFIIVKRKSLYGALWVMFKDGFKSISSEYSTELIDAAKKTKKTLEKIKKTLEKPEKGEEGED